jgi:CelD/BcsL family acetyltransferase involved in cellulose biosynthesis
LIRTCAQQGWLRLGICRVDGEPAAAQLWIVANGIASIYKLAYDEKFASLSIGSILTARLMRHAIDIDKVREIDYLTGDEPYKQDWMSHRRTRWGIVAFNLRSPRGLLSAARHIGASKLKSWILGRGSPNIRPNL